MGNKFHDLPLNAKFLIEGLSVSLKQNNDHPINYYQRTSILFSEELSKPVELMTDFSINDIHGDVVDYDHKVIRMIQVDKITSKMLISKPLVQTADYDPNSLSLGVTFDILSPEISINYEQFDVIKNTEKP